MAFKHINLILSMLMAAVLTTGCGLGDQSNKEDLEDYRERDFFCIAPDEAERMADQVLQLVNLERAAAGLAPVIANPVLERVAGEYACRMVELGFFGHEDVYTGYGPGARALAYKYPFYAIGENLAAGQETPAQAMRVWMASESHRAVILDPKWKEVGIAVRSGGEYGAYWVQEFGAPMPRRTE
ncbi:MAG: CAP domain-containing protein [Phycisphaerales bacterium]|nr:MAG: CAP domain-containing protein [Phycisphaerales bacterium]